jgi:hypothetical protein
MTISDPKLKQAREEIDAICTRYDIAGFFVLHNAPGNAEHWLRISPSYSCARMEGDFMRFRSKLSDYGDDRGAQLRTQAATANMVRQLATIAAQAAVPLLEVAAMLDKKTGAEHGATEYQPDPPKGSH